MRWSVSLSWLSWASSVGAPTQSEMVVLSADFIEKWAFYLKCHELLQRRHPKRLDQLQTRSYTACLHVKLNAKHYFIVWLIYFSMTINLIKPGSWLLIFNQISQNLYIPFLLFLHWRTHTLILLFLIFSNLLPYSASPPCPSSGLKSLLRTHISLLLLSAALHIS